MSRQDPHAALASVGSQVIGEITLEVEIQGARKM